MLAQSENYRRIAITVWAWIGILVLLGLALFVLFQIRGVLLPFFYALMIVYLLRPLIVFLEKRGMPRIWAVVLTYLAMITLLVLFGFFIVPLLVAQITSFTASFPTYISDLRGPVDSVMRQYRALHNTELATFLDGAIAAMRSFAMRIAGTLPQITIQLFGGVLNVVLGFLLAFYILKDLRVIKQTILEAIPERHRLEGQDIIRKIDLVLGGFLKGQILVALSVAVLASIALAILGINYALLIGLIIGIFNVIPYFGPVIGAIPAVVIALSKSWTLALVVIAVLFAIQQLDSILISPNIMRQQVNLHPVIVIFALLAGGTLFGVIGLLIAIPVAAVGKAVYLHFRERPSEPEATLPEMAEAVSKGKLL